MLCGEQVLAILVVEVAAAAEFAATDYGSDGAQLSSILPAVQLTLSETVAQQAATLLLRSENIRQTWSQHPLVCTRNPLLSDHCGADMVASILLSLAMPSVVSFSSRFTQHPEPLFSPNHCCKLWFSARIIAASHKTQKSSGRCKLKTKSSAGSTN